MPDFIQRLSKTVWTIIGNSCKFDSFSVQNPSKTTPDRWKCVLGAFLAPNRVPVRARAASSDCRVTLLAHFWLKMALRGAIFESGGEPNSGKRHTFGCKSPQGPSKNDLWKGGWKKHENVMENRCKNGSFLMARNHVWRYTLHLFQTFAVVLKSR